LRPVGKLLALDQHFFRRQLLLDEHRRAFRDQAQPRQAVVSALPAWNELFDIGDLLRDVTRMAGVAGQAALELFADHLPEADLGGGRRDELQQRLARRGAQMVETTCRTGAQHLDPGEIRRKLHVVVGEVRQHRKHQMRKPVFQQEAVPEAFEQMIIEMLVRVDEAGNDNHPACIDRAIDGHLWSLGSTADAFDLASVDQDKSAGVYTSPAIDGHHVTALDQDCGHSRGSPFAGETVSPFLWRLTRADALVSAHLTRNSARLTTRELQSQPLCTLKYRNGLNAECALDSLLGM
jgi:hypothetical protein